MKDNIREHERYTRLSRSVLCIEYQLTGGIPIVANSGLVRKTVAYHELDE